MLDLMSAGFSYGVRVFDENENVVDCITGMTQSAARSLAITINNGAEEYAGCYATVFKMDRVYQIVNEEYVDDAKIAMMDSAGLL